MDKQVDPVAYVASLFDSHATTCEMCGNEDSMAMCEIGLSLQKKFFRVLSMPEGYDTITVSVH